MPATSRREIFRSLAVLGSVCALGRGDAGAERNYEDSDAYRVYSLLLAQALAPRSVSLVIASRTVSSAMCLQPEGESAEILGSAISNYKKLAANRWRLTREFTVPKPYTLIEQSELDLYFGDRGGGWNQFYAHYPDTGGYFFLSPAGFNATKDIAVVQVNHGCGVLCGDGSFSVLQKRNGEWQDLPWNGSRCLWAS